MIDTRRAADVALAAALEASALVLEVYATAFDVDYKGKDDPVTRADRESNALICDRLSAAFAGVPIVAEESDPSSYAQFTASDVAWFVDPLDGTREFVARNGEFVVMIGLAQGGRAVLGVIVAPVARRTFVGVVDEGAWEVRPDGTKSPIAVSTTDTLAGASVLVSRSRTPIALAARLVARGAATPTIRGSAGLKAALIATGEFDVYLQPAPAGMRWDACASDALVRAAGGLCTEIDGASVDYARERLVNDGGLLAANRRLHPAVLDALRVG